MAEEIDKSELEQIVQILQAHGVEFVVIGGQAEILHGGSRITEDVDICYRRTNDNIVRLARAVHPLHPQLRGAPAGLPFELDAKTIELGNNFTLSTALIDLHLLGHVEPLGGYEEIKRNAILYREGDLDIWTIGVDDLLKVKLHINRPKDQESIAQLKAIKRLLEEQDG